MLKPLYSFSFVIILGVLITACSSNDDEQSDGKAYVKTPAWPILEKEQSLEAYYHSNFDYDESRDYSEDSFSLFFNQFKPQSNVEPDKDDPNQHSNDLLFTEASFKDNTRQWISNQIADAQNAIYQKDRAYRIWKNGQLQAAKTGKNQALHEAIDDNVFSYFLGTTFVWDLGKHKLAKETDLSEKRIERYQTTPEGLRLLPDSEQWAKVNREKRTFSQGAKYYPLTLSVAEQNTVIEAVSDGTGFSLEKASMTQNLPDLTGFINSYQEPNRFEYRFSNSPRSTDNHRVFISFDVATQTTIFSEAATGPSLISAVPFALTDNQQVLEIDLQAISHSQKATLGFSSLFNPVVIGPINENGGSHFYYGKRYLKTSASMHDDLPVQVLFNGTAAKDIRNAFKAFRQEKFDDQNL